MTFDVQVHATIERSPADVAAFMFDPQHDPEWIGGIVTVAPPDEPIGVGSETPRQARFMGRSIDYVLRVVEFEPGRRLRMESVQAPFPMGVTYQVEPAGPGSRVGLRVTGGYGILMRIMSPIIRRQVRRNLASDLRRLRTRLETIEGGSMP